MRIDIKSRGCPFAATQQVSVALSSPQPSGQLDVALPDGSLLQFNKGYATTADGTLVHFDKQLATTPDGQTLSLDDQFFAAHTSDRATNLNNLTVRLPGLTPKAYDARLTTVNLMDDVSLRFRLGHTTASYANNAPQFTTKSVRLALPSGTCTYYEKDQITVLFPIPQGTMTVLPDKTRVRFNGSDMRVEVPGYRQIHADLRRRTATFSNGTMRTTNVSAMAGDFWLGLLFVFHLSLCGGRLERVKTQNV